MIVKKNMLQTASASKATQAVALVLLLSGCNQMGMTDRTTTGSIFGAPEQAAFSHAIAEQRPLGDALVQIPYGAGEALNLTQTRYGNGVEQLVVYGGDNGTRGENAVRVKLVAPASRFGKRSEDLKIAKVSHHQILSEMRKNMPGVSMQIANQMHSNAYGVFGYAIGRAGAGVKCIYGWQSMSGTGNDRWAPLFGKSAKRKLSVRVRVCKTGASSQELVDLMRNIRVDDNPDRALRETAVSWRSGSNADLTTAMPTYEPGGYTSEELEAAPEPVQPRVRKVRKKRKKVVRKARKQTPRQVVTAAEPAEQPKVAPRYSGVYSPPLPKDIGNASAQPKVVAPPKIVREVIAQQSAAPTNLVPVPSGGQVQQVQAPVSVTYTSPVAPAKIDPVTTAGTSNLVPLPN